jgi:uncharacterized Zn-binding protein involved in type VI secretion
MPAASRSGDSCSGHGTFPGRPSYGGSSDVFINGIGALRTGDGYVPHCSPKKCHSGSAAGGSGSVFVNGKPLMRIGDGVSCGSVSAMGSPNVFAGG